MFVLKFRWIQTQMFIGLSFGSFVYALTVRPFESTQANLLKVFNELIGLLIAYLLLALQDPYYDPNDQIKIGLHIVNLIYLMACFNVLFIAASAAKILKVESKKWHKEKLCQRIKAKIASCISEKKQRYSSKNLLS